MKFRYAACVLLLWAGACQKAEQTPSEPGKPVEVTPVAVAVNDDAVQRSDIAVPEDFEEEAFAQIDEDNLDEQLDALDREIGGDAE